jgi:hypothetical protein
VGSGDPTDRSGKDACFVLSWLLRVLSSCLLRKDERPQTVRQPERSTDSGWLLSSGRRSKKQELQCNCCTSSGKSFREHSGNRL